MKFILLLSIMFSQALFAKGRCLNDSANGGTHDLCLSIQKEYDCNSHGLACFWLNYSENGEGSCSPKVQGYGDFCKQFEDGHVCNSTSFCSWSGNLDEAQQSPVQTPNNEQKGTCGTTDRFYQAYCSSLGQNQCSWNSECIWIWF